MTLREKQSLFARLVASLIQEANRLGYDCTFGEAYRSPEEALRLASITGKRAIKRSLHCDRLAIDLLLFKDGIYLTKTEDYTPLGRWWQQAHSLCRWGGEFSDGNHFSLTHDNRQ